MDESEFEEVVDDHGLPENPIVTSVDGSRATEGVSDDVDSAEAGDVVLCLFYHSEILAAAVYYTDSSEMQIMPDEMDLSPDFKLLCTIFHQVKPTYVVTCPSLSQSFLWRLNSLLTGESVSVSPTADPPAYSEQLHFIPAKEFRYSSCRRSILELKLPFEPEDISEEDRHTFVMSLIDVSFQGLVSAVGGLLYFLQRTLTRLQLVASVDMPILNICSLSIKNMVWMDQETVEALQIFSPGLHPSSFKWASTKDRDGFCVYSLLNRCVSEAGVKHLRVLMSQPTKDINVINKRHQVISFCLKSVNEQTVKSLADSLVNVKSVMKILTRMTNAQASVGQWKAFYSTIYNAVLIGEVCKANAKDVTFFQEIADCLCDSIYIMSHCINRVMDFEKSAARGQIIIKEGISDDLDRLRENQSHVVTMMHQIAELELADLPEHVSTCCLTFIPEAGYFLNVRLWADDLSDDQLRALPNLHFRFRDPESASYKSARCYELDSMLGDWVIKTGEIESRIILKLVQYIQRNISPLARLTNLIAELDCLMALAKAARDFNLVQPQMTLEKRIDIRKGRHVLQELCVDMFVPNDTRSSEEDGFIKILNGPNASGKSVYLKQVALIVYLAHVGSCVPACSATVGVVDQIHTRIQPVDAVSSQISSFMVDLRQMSLAIRNCTRNSLVIIDEFGKGTLEVDGLGILAASLEHFIDQKNDSPHLFVSTHFHSLSKLLPPSNNIKVQHMQHMVEQGELVYLYRLLEGEVGESFALQVAQNHSLTRSHFQRAMQILNGLKNSENLTADGGNKLTRLSARRRTFLKTLSRVSLDDKVLGELKKELVGLRL